MDHGTVLHWLPCEALFKPYVLRFEKHCFLALSPKCINRQLVGFSYFITKTIILYSRFYPKNLVEKKIQQIFKLFINKLASISQNCHNCFLFRQGFVGFEIEKMLWKTYILKPFSWSRCVTPRNITMKHAQQMFKK